MPILLDPIPDPPTPVVVGLNLFDSIVKQASATAVLLPGMFPQTGLPTIDVPGSLRDMTPMLGEFPGAPSDILRGNNAPADGNVICSPCGEIFEVRGVQGMLPAAPISPNIRFQMTGVTKDSTGVALGNCRVVVLETGRLLTDAIPVVAEGMSDGSGNYSIIVPMNTGYQVIAYKPGSPDVAGVTVNNAAPVQA